MVTNMFTTKELKTCIHVKIKRGNLIITTPVQVLDRIKAIFSTERLGTTIGGALMNS